MATTGDQELLRRALDNLLANAVAHTPAGTTATLTAARHDSTITVDVSHPRGLCITLTLPAADPPA